MPDVYNPIQSVTPVNYDGTVTGATITEIPVPSTYEYTLVDISAPDAGRAEDLKMNKMRKGQTVRIDVKWSVPTFEDCSTILKAFNSEYLKINYFDAMENSYLEKIFYVGDRKAPMWSKRYARWESVGFGIIQQTADVV